MCVCDEKLNLGIPYFNLPNAPAEVAPTSSSYNKGKALNFTGLLTDKRVRNFPYNLYVAVTVAVLIKGAYFTFYYENKNSRKKLGLLSVFLKLLSRYLSSEDLTMF
ncbi:uncharacterized protein LOC108911398 [Anoplophora glabripennis]|uniref:uncharacterized protein LOC108911398 n=1 Tax=Anoplophora glabripennis TaxID=217634 RepID=UPI0008747B5F|nr:uncharacterized protein LOC108911398 [Anoplophora glabripennis]